MALSSSQQIKRGALISYVALFVNILAALLYTPWMIREIGQANYGLYTLAISFISLFLVDFGMSAALSRFLAKYRAENNKTQARRILGATYTVYFAIDFLILITLAIIYFNIEWIYKELNNEEVRVFKLIFILVGTFNLISFPAVTQNGILSSYEKFVELKICDLSRKLLAILFVVVALINKMGVIAVVCANISAELLIIICKYIIIKRKIPLTPRYRGLDKRTYSSIFNFSLWITIITFAQKFVYNIAPTILGIVAGAIAISIYGPASSLGGYFYAIAAAINGLFLPYVSRKVADRKEEDVQILMVKMGHFQFLLLGSILVAFITVGRMFIELWLGNEFRLTYYCTVLLFLPALFEYAQQIGCTLIIAKNAIKYQAIGFVTISICTLVLSFILGLKYGAVGVCCSISLAGFLNVWLQNWIFKHKLGLDVKKYTRSVVLPMLIPLSVTSVVGYIVISHIQSAWLTLLICATASCVCYWILSLACSKELRTLSKPIINRFFLSRLRKTE